jgi:hypothetical protein
MVRRGIFVWQQSSKKVKQKFGIKVKVLYLCITKQLNHGQISMY